MAKLDSPIPGVTREGTGASDKFDDISQLKNL